MPINSRPDIHRQVICANIFIRKGDEYLVLRRSPNKRYAPNFVHPVGGKVDLDENPYQAAIREAREEAGISIKNIRLEAVILEIAPEKDEPYNWLIFYFSADYDSGDVSQTEEGELIWLTADDFKQQQLFPSLGEVVDHVLDHEQGVVFARFEYGKNHTILQRTIDVCVVR